VPRPFYMSLIEDKSTEQLCILFYSSTSKAILSSKCILGIETSCKMSAEIDFQVTGRRVEERGKEVQIKDMNRAIGVFKRLTV